jgi:hypothetical protein
LIVVAALAGGLTLAVLLARGRSYQVDEVEHVHVAFKLHRGERLYADFWEGHNPLLYAVLYPLADLQDPEGSFERGRLVALGALLATVAASAWCAGRLAGGAAGTLAAGLLLLHSTFLERGIEVRPDGCLALATVLALAVELAPWSELRRHCLQAVLMSAAFLFTQKAVFACVGFGLLWLWSAARRRRLALAAVPLALWLVPVVLLGVVLWWQDSWRPYLEYNVVRQVTNVTRQASHHASFGAWRHLVIEGRRNLFFWVAALGGLTWLLRSRDPAGRQARTFTAILALLGLLSLGVNPFPFPYFHVTFLPLLAIAAGSGLASWGARRDTVGMRSRLWVASCLILAALTSTPRLVAKAVPGKAYQLQVLRDIHRATGEQDAVFDLAGLHARPDPYPIWVMTRPMMLRYRAGEFPPMIPAWRERELVAVIENYRIGWLPRPEAAFLDEHLVYYGSNIHLLGTEIGGLEPGEELRFEALKDARFRFEGPGTLQVDGASFAAGFLAKGWHVLSTETGISAGRLILDAPPPTDFRPPRELFEPFD